MGAVAKDIGKQTRPFFWGKGLGVDIRQVQC